jgi:hypothetical protein
MTIILLWIGIILTVIYGKTVESCIFIVISKCIHLKIGTMSYYTELLYDLLEPYAGKLARTVLRGEGISNNPDLPDNTKDRGQVILSTIGNIRQPKSEKYEPVDNLPFITDEFGELLKKSEEEHHTPSCSLAEALQKQDLFINASLAQMGCSLLWNLFRYGLTPYRGFFHNLKDFNTHPIKIA